MDIDFDLQLKMSLKELKEWYEILPLDIQKAFSFDVQATDSEIKELSDKFNSDDNYFTDYPILLEECLPIIEKLGHTGRIRLIAFLCKKTNSNAPLLFGELIEDDEGGRSRVGVLFIEELHILFEAMRGRFLQAYTDANVMNPALIVARELDSAAIGQTF